MQKHHWAILILILAAVGYVLYRRHQMTSTVINSGGNNPYGANYTGGFAPNTAGMAGSATR